MLILTLFACAGGGGPGQDLEPQITGTISTADAAADVEIYKAFGWAVDGKGLWYMASSPDATCDSVEEYLRQQQVDPNGIWAGNDCNITLVVSDGSYEAAGMTMSTSDNWLVGHWELSCALGEGAFEWGKRDDGAGAEDEDYFWTGVEWNGYPEDFSVDIAGDNDSEFTLDVDMSTFSGNYPTVIEDIPANGSISGSITAEACNLYQAQVFPQ